MSMLIINKSLQAFHKMLFLQFTETFPLCPLALHSNHPSVTSVWAELQLRPFYLYFLYKKKRSIAYSFTKKSQFYCDRAHTGVFYHDFGVFVGIVLEYNF